MADISTALTHEGVKYTATIVTIERTELGREDHGVFTARLHVTWGGGVTAIGGYTLDGQPIERDGKRRRRPGTDFGMQWVIETIDTVVGEYGQWEDLKGKRVFMLHDADAGHRLDGMFCRGIASLDGSRVMIFSKVIEHVGGRKTEPVSAL